MKKNTQAQSSKLHHARAIIFTTFLISASGAVIAQSLRDLGTLGDYSYAYGVSADGSIIVGEFVDGAQRRVFKYVDSTMVDLGGLIAGNNQTAWGVSADGSVIVGQSSLPGSRYKAFKLVGSTYTGLGALGNGMGDSYAQGASADGGVIVGSSQFSANSAFRAFKYVGTTMTSLGTLGGTNSYATAVSADGSVIVGNSEITGDTATRAFKYVGSTMTSLGTLGGTNSYATAVSADGSLIVGNSGTENDESLHPFIYSTISGSGLVDIYNTYSSLAANGYQLNSLLNAQKTALALNLHSDCTVYGANNMCFGVGGRYTNVGSPSSSHTAGSMQVGYRFAPSLRAGVFLDQGINNATPNNYTVKNSQPLAGIFAVYAPSGTHLGLQLKVSAAYSKNGVSITRTALANTEAGQGSATITTQGAQLEAAYGYAVGDGWVVSSLAGIKSTSVVRGGYTEKVGATFPITFNSVRQSATTTYVAANVVGYVSPKVSVGASAGVEKDLSSNVSDYSGSIYFLGAFNLAAPRISQTRPFFAANADYWVDKNQRISLRAHYSKQSLSTSNGITAMLNYSIAL